jgi:hypothetical protein
MTQIQRIFTDNRYSSFQIAVICAPVGHFKNQVTFLTNGTVILKIFRAGPAGGAAVLKIFRAGPAGGAAVLKIFRAGPAGGAVVLKIFRAGPAGGATVLKIFRACLNQDLQDSRISRIKLAINMKLQKMKRKIKKKVNYKHTDDADSKGFSQIICVYLFKSVLFGRLFGQKNERTKERKEYTKTRSLVYLFTRPLNKKLNQIYYYI